MKKIYIARHASTHHAKEGQKDRNRPLTHKGQEEALWLGGVMNKLDQPSNIVSSSALRAKETALRVQENLDEDISIEFSGDLYLASAEVILKNLKGFPDELDTIVFIGHNPGLSQFLLQISGPNSNQTAAHRIYRGLPPAGLAVLESSASSWKQMATENTRLVKLLHPGE